MASAFEGLAPAEREQMLALGPRWAEDINRHREQVVAIYTPHLQALGPCGVVREAGIAYGEHPRQRLDLYRPAGLSQPAPVVVFVHGGAFLRGNMNSNAEIYGNVTRYIARHGYVAVNLEYRLAPEAPYPAGALDIAQALAWLRAHVASYGGDPGHIVLVGHSAGGAHAATYALDPTLPLALARRAVREAGWDGDNGGLSGLVLISARLRADVRADNPNAAGVRAYWGQDESRYELLSPVTHVTRLSVPTLVAIAEFENPHLDRYGEEFQLRACAAGAPCSLLRVPGHNHTSIVAHLGTADPSFGPALMAFLDSTRAAGAART
ncbi:MAG: alpha/beta hydrolase [Sphingomonadaceae bacterium]